MSRGGGVFNASAKKLAAFLTSVEAQETLLAQRLRDIETKKVLSGIGGDPLPGATRALLSQAPRIVLSLTLKKRRQRRIIMPSPTRRT